MQIFFQAPQPGGLFGSIPLVRGPNFWCLDPTASNLCSLHILSPSREERKCIQFTQRTENEKERNSHRAIKYDSSFQRRERSNGPNDRERERREERKGTTLAYTAQRMRTYIHDKQKQSVFRLKRSAFRSGWRAGRY